MSKKKSEIISVEHMNDWTAPTGNVVHYHIVKMANGDVGQIGRKYMFPKDMRVGMTVEYTVDDDKRMKLIDSAQNIIATIKQGNKATYLKNKKKVVMKKNTEVDYLSQCFLYAKDIVCAKINTGEKVGDVSVEMIKTARILFNEMNKITKEQADLELKLDLE